MSITKTLLSNISLIVFVFCLEKSQIIMEWSVFRFSNYKNYNVDVDMSTTSVSVVKTFLFNIFLAISTFSLAKIVI